MPKKKANIVLDDLEVKDGIHLRDIIIKRKWIYATLVFDLEIIPLEGWAVTSDPFDITVKRKSKEWKIPIKKLISEEDWCESKWNKNNSDKLDILRDRFLTEKVLNKNW